MTTNSGQEHAGEGVAERITDYLTNGGLFNPEHMPHGAARDLLIDCRAALEKLTRERDEARLKLFPYADAKEISGMSWNGFYLIGDEKSIKELRRIENRSSQLETYAAAFDARIAALEAENAKMREALKPFAEIADEYAPQEDASLAVWKDFDVLGSVTRLTLKHFRAARAILGEQP